MKNILFTLLLLPAYALAQPSKDFTLRGTLALAEPAEWIYLRYSTGNNDVFDSVKTTDGSFSFKGTLDEPTVAYFIERPAATPALPRPAAHNIPILLQPGNLRLAAKDSLNAYTLEGSPRSADLDALTAARKPFNNAMQKLDDQYRTAKREGRTDDMRKLDEAMEAVDKQMQDAVYGNYVRMNPTSPLALYALKQYAGWEIDANTIAPLFARLPADVQKWPSAIEFNDRITIARKTAIGQPALDFSQNDTSGHAVSLSSFKGKYVLVDFWASWCGPCRAENPNVVKAFNQYKDRNFTILGVSLDRPTGRDRWLKAIHDDGLAWNHVSDLKFWDNEVAKAYGIRAIPQNLLIDPQGKIIAKNLSGDELAKKLGEVIK